MKKHKLLRFVILFINFIPHARSSEISRAQTALTRESSKVKQKSQYRVKNKLKANKTKALTKRKKRVGKRVKVSAKSI